MPEGKESEGKESEPRLSGDEVLEKVSKYFMRMRRLPRLLKASSTLAQAW